LALLGGAILFNQLDVSIRYTRQHDLHKAIRNAGSETVDNFSRWNWVEAWRPVGEWLRRHAAPDERLATAAAGIIPYTSRLSTIDIRGLNNRYVARLEVKHRRRRIGHERLAPESYLQEQGITYYNKSPRRGGTQLDVFIARSGGDNDAILVQLLNGKWWEFRTFVDPDGLRRKLRERGAIVYPGPNEDPKAVEEVNLRHREQQGEVS
jgi:hypothetical protein